MSTRFRFPPINDIYDLQVKLQIICSYTQTTFKKELHLQSFLEKFKSLKNQKQKDIKQLVLNSLRELKKFEYIQDTVEIHFKNGTVREFQIDKLTTLQIGKTQVLYYHELLYSG